MTNPYTEPSISGYNSSPPSDDGANTSANEIKWATHKDKLADPLKNYADSINSAITTAFSKNQYNSVSSKSANYTIVSGDRGKYFSCTNTITITLLAAASAGDGFSIIIKNDGTGVVTVDGDGSETVLGSATLALPREDYVVLVCDGSNWKGVGNKTDVTQLTVDSPATTGNSLTIECELQTTGDALYINDTSGARTTGRLAYLYSSSSDTGTRNLLEIVNDNSAATGSTVLKIQQDAAQACFDIDQNGNNNSIIIDSESTTADVISVTGVTTTGNALNITEDFLTTGNAIRLFSNSNDTAARSLLSITNFNTLATNAFGMSIFQLSSAPAMRLVKQTSDGGMINFQADADADTTSAISTLTTSGGTTHHIQVEINGTKAWIAASTSAPS